VAHFKFFLGILVSGSEKFVKMMSLCSLREGQVLGEMPQAFGGEGFSDASHSLQETGTNRFSTYLCMKAYN
jgi:hypothetical protein